MTTRKRTGMTCPSGHRFSIPRVVYGYPSDETWAAERSGDVTIGGCLPDLPVERLCPECGLPAISDPELASRMASRVFQGESKEDPERPI